MEVTLVQNICLKREKNLINRSECYAELKNQLQNEGPQVLRHTANSTLSQNIDEYYNDEDREKLELNKTIIIQVVKQIFRIEE